MKKARRFRSVYIVTSLALLVSINWFSLALISAFFFGVQTLFTKVVLNTGLSSSLVTAYVFTITSIFLWVYVFFTQKIALPSTQVSWVFVIMGVIALISNLTLFRSYQLTANPGYVRAVSSLSILITLLISLFVFHLKLNFASAAGAVLVTAGTILLAFYV